MTPAGRSACGLPVRTAVLGALLALAWGGMLVRVFHVQIVRGEHFAGMVERQSKRRNIVTPQRGEIWDARSRKLVVNATVDLTFREGRRSRTRSLERVCPLGSLAGQILGCLGHDGTGQSGLEYDQDGILRGADGWQYARYDVRRRYYPGFEEQGIAPEHGMNLRLTLDADLQRAAEQALERGVRRVGAKGGVAILIQPATGDILAMANYPFFDPNRRSTEDMKGWKNQAVSKVYEPGSTFKVMTAAAVLEEGAVRPDEKIFAEKGRYRLGGALIHDTKPLGQITLGEALAHSSNIFMAKASSRVEPDDMYRYLRSFGFGMKTGICLPGEESGTLKEVQAWSARTQATLAWGQELAVTPLQLAMAFAAIANEGVLMKPRLIRAWLDPEGNPVKAFEPREVRRVVSVETARRLRELLRGVVEYGTARSIRTPRYTIAGKTGTVEKIDPATGQYSPGRFHASFAGMAPADNPDFACLVLVDEPRVDKYGGSSAAPIFREILDRAISITANHIAGPIGPAGAPGYFQGEPRLASFHPDPSSGRVDAQAGTISQGEAGGSRAARVPSLPPFDPAGTGDAGEMPDLRGLSLRDAMTRLRGMGVEMKYTGIGQVLHQTPAPGARLETGAFCRLRLGWSS